MALMVQYENDPELLAALLQSMRDAKIDCIVVAEEPGMDVDASLVCTV